MSYEFGLKGLVEDLLTLLIGYQSCVTSYSAEKYFTQITYRFAVSDFNLVISLLIFFGVINFLYPFLENLVPSREYISPDGLLFHKRPLILTVLTGIVKTVFALWRKRFILYCSKGYFHQCESVIMSRKDRLSNNRPQHIQLLFRKALQARDKERR